MGKFAEVLFIVLATLAIALSASAVRAENAPVTTPATVPNPLATAKTVSVHEQQYICRFGTKRLNRDINITFERPYSARAEIRWGASGQLETLYVCDSTTGYTYDGINTLTKLVRASTGFFIMGQWMLKTGLSPVSNPPGWPYTNIDLLTTGVVPDAGASIETIDGKQVMVDHITGGTYWKLAGRTMAAMVYVDAQTGLPIKYVKLHRGPDKPFGGPVPPAIQMMPTEEVDFDNWKIDAPVDPSTFVFTPPPGATFPTQSMVLEDGTAVPDFATVTPVGDTVRLSDYRGQIVVLDLWATWCPYCEPTLNHLDKIYDQLKDQGVSVLAVCVLDDRPSFDNWVAAKRDTIKCPVVFDPHGKQGGSIASDIFHVPCLPVEYVIDGNGRVAASFVGYQAGPSGLDYTLGRLGVHLTTQANSQGVYPKP